ncbi:unnamed protein product, partial [Discosporangium mesarthrocarpum]
DGGTWGKGRAAAGTAASMFQRALDLDPGSLEALYGVAHVLQQAGDSSSARQLFLFLGERAQSLLGTALVAECSPRGSGGQGWESGGGGGPFAASTLSPRVGAGARHNPCLFFPLEQGGGLAT